MAGPNAPLLCGDPLNCDEEHNEIDLSSGELPHHYGCGCDECMAYYQHYLK
jgi:hypothetical protein